MESTNGLAAGFSHAAIAAAVVNATIQGCAVKVPGGVESHAAVCLATVVGALKAGVNLERLSLGAKHECKSENHQSNDGVTTWEGC
jgi:NaMN:DMB phosphoribosyltransferase